MDPQFIQLAILAAAFWLPTLALVALYFFRKLQLQERLQAIERGADLTVDREATTARTRRSGIVCIAGGLGLSAANVIVDDSRPGSDGAGRPGDRRRPDRDRPGTARRLPDRQAGAGRLPRVAAGRGEGDGRDEPRSVCLPDRRARARRRHRRDGRRRGRRRRTSGRAWSASSASSPPCSRVGVVSGTLVPAPRPGVAAGTRSGPGRQRLAVRPGRGLADADVLGRL